MTLNGLPRRCNLRGSSIDLNDFITWAQDKQATVFQAHLLAYRNQLTVHSNANSGARMQTRRFLAVGKLDGEIIHVEVECPAVCTVYDGAKNTFEGLHSVLGLNILWMINLDSGGTNISKCYENRIDNADYLEFRGTAQLSESPDLLVYYYEN